MEPNTHPNARSTLKVRDDFCPLKQSTLLVLHEFPVFGTTGEVMHCTKFSISRLHWGSLRLDRENPIHAEDIYRLTGLFVYGVDVSSAFQKNDKRSKKTDVTNLYKMYGTTGKGREAVLDMINNMLVRVFATIIATKLMRHFTRVVCSLDVISVGEACVRGDQLNWSSYLLNELFDGSHDVYTWPTYFVFGYLLLPLAMYKWCTLEG